MTAGQKEPRLVTVVLDGENPWEGYQDSGQPFLAELYRRLSLTPSLKTVKIGDHLREHPPRSIITKIHSGSWINHDFDIWIGTHEENLAWQYLGQARKILEPALTDEQAPVERRQEALEALYAAEGSDWFWWYGDDFTSDHDDEFDRLFRGHLIHAFKALRREVPEFLHRSILHLHPAKHVREPVNFITPSLEGRLTSYFEWQGAGYYNPALQAIRYHAERTVVAIYYGFDLAHLYLRVDPSPHCTPEQKGRLTLQFNFFSASKPSQVPRGEGLLEYRITIPCSAQRPLGFKVQRSEDGITFHSLFESDRIAFVNLLELAIPFEKLGWKPNHQFNFMLEVLEEGKVVEVYPPNGYIPFAVPDEDFELRMWSV
jgi:hypothetical protein